MAAADCARAVIADRLPPAAIMRESALMIIHYLVTSLESGGAESSIPKIIDVMKKCGHHVQVYAFEPRDRGAEPLFAKAGISYTLLSNSKASKLGSFLRYMKVARQSRPDIIWTSLSHATIVGQVIGLILKIPVVSWKHNVRTKIYLRWSKSLTRLWIADSSTVATHLAQTMGICPDMIVTWQLFVSPPAQTTIQRWHTDRSLQIGSSGRLHPQKNYDHLIRAIGRLREVNPLSFSRIDVSIAGDGPMRSELEQLIISLGFKREGAPSWLDR